MRKWNFKFSDFHFNGLWGIIIFETTCHIFCKFCVTVVTLFCYNINLTILWTKWGHEISKFQNFHSLYYFWNNPADFLKIMHYSSMPWQLTVDSLDRAMTWNFKFSNYQLFCETAIQVLPYTCKHFPALPFTTLLCTTNPALPWPAVLYLLYYWYSLDP